MNDTVINAHGQTWLVRYARSLADAQHAIDMAAARGSVGSKHFENNTLVADIERWENC